VGGLLCVCEDAELGGASSAAQARQQGPTAGPPGRASEPCRSCRVHPQSRAGAAVSILRAAPEMPCPSSEPCRSCRVHPQSCAGDAMSILRAMPELPCPSSEPCRSCRAHPQSRAGAAVSILRAVPELPCPSSEPCRSCRAHPQSRAGAAMSILRAVPELPCPSSEPCRSCRVHPQSRAGAAVPIPPAWKPKPTPGRQSQPASCSASLPTAVAQAALPERGSGLRPTPRATVTPRVMSALRPLTWARDGTGMMKLLLVLTLLVLSFSISPSWCCHSSY